MFVLRYTNDEGETKYRAFEKMDDAKRYYDAAWLRVIDNEFSEVALFAVRDTNEVRIAIDAVKTARGTLKVELLELEADEETRMKRLAGKIELDL